MLPMKKSEPFKRSRNITLSPSSPRHPSNPLVLRARPKPPLTPVMRAIFHPHPLHYPAAFRGQS